MLPVSQRALLQLAGPETVHPALLYRNMHFRGQRLHFGVHHDRPITVLSLDRQYRYEKLSWEQATIAIGEGFT